MCCEDLGTAQESEQTGCMAQEVKVSPSPVEGTGESSDMQPQQQTSQQQQPVLPGQPGQLSRPESGQQRAEEAVWDPLRFLPSTLGDPDEHEGAEASLADGPLDRKACTHLSPSTALPAAEIYLKSRWQMFCEPSIIHFST